MFTVCLPIPFTRSAILLRQIQMIWLTRLNNQALMVNSDLIKFVEKSPDTVITLVTGEKLIVRESVQAVLERVVEFRRSIVPHSTVHPQTPSPLTFKD